MQLVAMYLFFTGVHIDAKKSLNRLAFMQRSEMNLLLVSNCGIFLLYKNCFNIDQYVLGAVLGLLSLLVILIM